MYNGNLYVYSTVVRLKTAGRRTTSLNKLIRQIQPFAFTQKYRYKVDTMVSTHSSRNNANQATYLIKSNNFHHQVYSIVLLNDLNVGYIQTFRLDSTDCYGDRSIGLPESVKLSCIYVPCSRYFILSNLLVIIYIEYE